MMYLGDYEEDAILDFKWSSNAADGASITRATNGTISVYKANNTTQTTAGVTDTEDFDSLTGIHHCRIDLSADAFYEVANDYMVVLSGATIDGKSVNAVLAHFSIEHRYMRGTDGANTSTPPTAAAVADAVWDEDITEHDTESSAGEALSAAGASASDIADAIWDEALAGHAAAGSAGAALADARDGNSIAGSATAAANAKSGYESLVSGQAVTGTLSTTVLTTNLTETTNDHYNGRMLTFISGALSGQQTQITDYNGSTKALTVMALTEAPANGDKFIIS